MAGGLDRGAALVGGFGSSVSDEAWARADEDNDQSARAFREAGVVLMLSYPRWLEGEQRRSPHRGCQSEMCPAPLNSG